MWNGLNILWNIARHRNQTHAHVSAFTYPYTFGMNEVSWLFKFKSFESNSMQHGSKTLILRPCHSVPFSVDLACENVNYGSDSLAALSPSFGRDFHIHYIISGTMIIAVILSVSCVFFSALSSIPTLSIYILCYSRAKGYSLFKWKH